MSEADVKYRDDPRLTPEEKETYIRFAKDEDRATVHTDESSIARRLLSHHAFEETKRYVGEGDTVHGVEGTIPIGYISIGTGGRSTPGHASMISQGVFEDE